MTKVTQNIVSFCKKKGKTLLLPLVPAVAVGLLCNYAFGEEVSWLLGCIIGFLVIKILLDN
jgi:hypothetical protein